MGWRMRTQHRRPHFEADRVTAYGRGHSAVRNAAGARPCVGIWFLTKQSRFASFSTEEALLTVRDSTATEPGFHDARHRFIAPQGTRHRGRFGGRPVARRRGLA